MTLLWLDLPSHFIKSVRFPLSLSYFSTLMSVAPTNIINMPSESSFKKQAEVARGALKNFNMVRNCNSPAVIKIALNELVDAIVRASFLIFFVLF
jgi:hypothetical protein